MPPQGSNPGDATVLIYLVIFNDLLNSVIASMHPHSFLMGEYFRLKCGDIVINSLPFNAYNGQIKSSKLLE